MDIFVGNVMDIFVDSSCSALCICTYVLFFCKVFLEHVIIKENVLSAYSLYS